MAPGEQVEQDQVQEQDQTEAVHWFQNDWQNYQLVLQGDHLEHQCLYNGIQSLLAKQWEHEQRPLKLLDLGCGDAEYICRVFKRLMTSGSDTNSSTEPTASQHQAGPLLESYTGVDLTGPALALARQHLAAVLHSKTAIHLHLADMLSWLSKQVDSYDVVIISFALHHLALEDKLQVLVHARRLLSSGDASSRGGMLLLADVFRQPDEQLEPYLQRFASDIESTWDMLDARGKNLVKSHVCQYDHPESLATYQQLALQAGYAAMDVLAEGKKGFSKLVVFRC